MFLPDVGWKVADHVDIRDDKVVSQQEMAQQVLLLTGVAEQLLTEQAAHVLPSGNPNNDFCQQHDTTFQRYFPNKSTSSRSLGCLTEPEPVQGNPAINPRKK